MSFCMERAHIFLLIFLLKLNGSIAILKFTNLQCSAIDTEFLDVRQCAIKALSRLQNVATLRAVPKTDVTDALVSVKILKWANGWRVLPFKFQLNTCDFFRAPHRNPLAQLIYTFIKPYTNVNHTCPYMAGDELKIDSMKSDEDGFLKVFPIPVGDYALFSTWRLNSKKRIEINCSIKYTDYKNRR